MTIKDRANMDVNLERPDIFSFRSAYDYLNAYINYLKSNSRYFSFRSISKKAGFRSPNYIQAYLNRQRQVSRKAAQRLAKVFGLDYFETEFYLLLVELDSPRSNFDQLELLKRVERIVTDRGTRYLREDQLDYYSEWYIPVVRELIASFPGGCDVQILKNRLKDCLSGEDIEKALSTLISLGLVDCSEGSRYQCRKKKLKTKPTVSSHKVRQFHRDMIRFAEQALDKLPLSERAISGITLSISKDRYEELQSYLAEVRHEIVKRFTEESSVPQEVFQLNMQLFPLTSLKFNVSSKKS